MGFCRVALAERESATPVRRPAAVIVADYSLGLAIAESDAVGRHSCPPLKGSRRAPFLLGFHHTLPVGLSPRVLLNRNRRTMSEVPTRLEQTGNCSQVIVVR